MRYRIALCDTDAEYVMLVSEYIRGSEYRKTIELTAFTDYAKLWPWMEKEAFDAAAIGVDGVTPGDGRWRGDERIVWIGEREESADRFGMQVVSKYEPVPRLLQAWLRRASANGAARRRAPVVAVWSAAGGAGKTKLATRLAFALSSAGSDLFVVGWDPGLLESGDTDGIARYDVSEWLFAMKSGSSPAIAAEDGVRARLRAFSRDVPMREWAELDRKHSGWLLDAASASGVDALVVDAGSGWTAFAEEAWSRAEIVLCVSPAEETGMRKTDLFLRDWPLWNERPDLREKTVFVLNKCLGNSARAGPTWTNRAYRLPYVPEWKQSWEHFDPLYQIAVAKLAEDVWKRCVCL